MYLVFWGHIYKNWDKYHKVSDLYTFYKLQIITTETTHVKSLKRTEVCSRNELHINITNCEKRNM